MNKTMKKQITIRKKPLPEISKPYITPIVEPSLSAILSGNDEPTPQYSHSILLIQMPFNRLSENGTDNYLKNHNKNIEIKHVKTIDSPQFLVYKKSSFQFQEADNFSNIDAKVAEIEEYASTMSKDFESLNIPPPENVIKPEPLYFGQPPTSNSISLKSYESSETLDIQRSINLSKESDYAPKEQKRIDRQIYSAERHIDEVHISRRSTIPEKSKETKVNWQKAFLMATQNDF